MADFNRRTFLNTGVAAVGLAGVPFHILGADSASSSGPVANTTSGKIRGRVVNKVQAFQGIPYGAPTGGNRRYLPAAKPEPWTGIKDTISWGDEAPQGPHTEIPEVAATIPKTGLSEDCLRLNVWTNSLKGKRPVMVWFHGGGFTSGNGSYTIYDGANLARKHDVVQVTVNHRLNTFGFLYLADKGGRFAEASNVGITDCVAALQWVKDNIANFGGDPNNVTIYGQSGGAGKVSTLLAMPSAKGLFHRAIIQSGSNLAGTTVANAVRATETFMAKVNAKTPDDLQKLSMQDLIQATLTTPGVGGGPVVDGKTLPNGPFDPTAPEMSNDVPVIIGTTEYEVTFFPNTKYDPLDDAQLKAAFAQQTGGNADNADKLLASYKKGRPKASNLELSLVLASDNFRGNVITEAERKAAQKAPVYMYYFTWQSPVSGGKLRSFHTLEIPFVNYNVDDGKSMTGSGQDRYALQDKMSTAWTNFARTGNPNHKGLPQWTPFEMSKRATMIFDNTCQVVNDPHGEERLAYAQYRGAAGRGGGRGRG